MTRSRSLLVLAVLLSASSAFAQDQIIDLSGGAARVARGTPQQPLTGPSTESRARIVAGFLSARFDEATLNDLVATREDPPGAAVQHVAFGQRVAGLDVYGTYVRAALSPRGELLSVVENLVPARALRPARVGPEQALAAVLARFYPGAAAPRETGAVENTYTYERGDRFDQAPTVTRIAVPLQGSVLDTGYLVVTWDRENVLRHTVVSGGGVIVYEELRTNFDTYRVYTNSPTAGPQENIAGPGSGNAESPIGWVSSNTTIGNNVDAYLDRDNNNAADAGGRPENGSQDFLFTYDTDASPTATANNQMAAVTNLFYLNNVLHDRLYKYGFNEAAGNFQTNNFGKGGSGNDPVNAEAQDGGGTNNANFATPSDGSRPRMQMYIWTAANPDRDGDLDSDIVYHEYGHGLTWRMIGNMSGPFAGAIGEGMSDVLAIYFNGDDRVAEYSYNNPIGIRSEPYTNYSRTYGDLTGNSVHFDGEIYAATMWRLRQLWMDDGRNTEELLTHIVQGMNYTPPRPQYEDMRNGILQAITSAGGSDAGDKVCTVWEAFAAFGIGEGANGTETCRGVACRFSVTESFDLPSSCTSSGGNTAPVVTISAPSNDSSYAQGTSITFTGSASDTQDGDLSGSLDWMSSRDGAIATNDNSFSISTLSVGTHIITASVTDSGSLTGQTSITVTVTSAPPPGGITLTATTTKIKGVNIANLSWTGATGSVDVKRNGGTIATVSGSTYSDNTGTKGGQSFSYQVCLAGTSTCSNTLTVTF